MHCYNEAIRRTRGSYVIFPGPSPGTNPHSQKSGEKPPMFSLYHELLPGVGAFRFLPVFGPGMQPSCDGQDCLVEFLRDVLVNQEDQFSQREAIEEKVTAIIRERPRAKIHRGRFAPSEQPGASVDTPALVGFIRDSATAACRARGLFYFYARKNGEKFSIPDGLRTGIPFLPYTEAGWLGWKGYVKSITSVSREELADILKKGGMQNPALSAEVYFLARVDSITDLTKSQVAALDKHPTAPHRPKVGYWNRFFSVEKFPAKTLKAGT